MRGTEAPPNTTRTSQNGYQYTKVGSEWRLTHHLIAEERLGRRINPETERVIFVDKDRANLSPSNVKVVPKGKTSVKRRIAAIEARIAELEAQKAELEKELNDGQATRASQAS